MTPTPRTDAAECEAFIGVSSMDSSDVQNAYDFARQLERELAEAQARISRQRAALETARDVLDKGNDPMGCEDEHAQFILDWSEALSAITAALEDGR